MSDTIDISLRAEDEFSKVFKKYNESLKTADKGTKDLDVSTASLAGGSMSKLAVNSAMATAALVASVGITAKLTGNFLKLADRVAGLADDMGESAEKANVSSVFYQKLGGIASKSGTDIGVLTASMRALTMQTTQAQQGNKESIETYRKLGVSITDASGAMKSQETLFNEVLIALSSMPKGFERSSIAMKLFGRSSAELNTVLNQGSDALNKQLGATSEYVTISKRLEEAGSNLKDRQIELNAVWEKARNEALTPNIELMGDLTEEMVEFAKSKGVQDTVKILKTIAENGSSAAKQFGNMTGILSVKSKKLEDSQAGYNERLREYNKLKEEVIKLSLKDGKSESEENVLKGKKARLKALVMYEEGIRERAREKEQADAVASLKAQKAEESRIKKEAESKEPKKEKEFKETTASIRSANELVADQAKYQGFEENKKSWLAKEQAMNKKSLESGVELSDIRTQKLQEETNLMLEEWTKREEAEARAKESAIQSAFDISASVQSIASSNSSIRLAEISREEEAIRKSTMSDKQKAKAIEALEKKRRAETLKSAKVQAAFNISVAAAQVPLAIIDAQLVALRAMRDGVGGVAARTAQGLSMLAIGMGFVGQIKSAQASIAGAREFGGNVRAGSLYEVGERGDEMFSAGGRNYLLPGRSGTVSPNNTITNAGNNTINAYFNIYESGDANVTAKTIVTLLNQVDRDGSMDWGGMKNLKRAVA